MACAPDYAWVFFLAIRTAGEEKRAWEFWFSELYCRRRLRRLQSRRGFLGRNFLITRVPAGREIPVRARRLIAIRASRVALSTTRAG